MNAVSVLETVLTSDPGNDLARQNLAHARQLLKAVSEIPEGGDKRFGGVNELEQTLLPLTATEVDDRCRIEPEQLGRSFISNCSRCLQRLWLRTSSTQRFVDLLKLPVILDLRHVPYYCSEAMGLATAALSVAYCPFQAIVQQGTDLVAVSWVLLNFGLRGSQCDLLQAALAVSPVPESLAVIRQHGYCGHALGPRANPKMDLEGIVLEALSRIRVSELARMSGFWPQDDKESDSGALTDEDRLQVLERRTRLLESLLLTPPKVYLPSSSNFGRGTVSHPPMQTMFRNSISRGRQGTNLFGRN